jgi:hypothetical protein
LGTITDFDAARGDRLVDFRGLQLAAISPPFAAMSFGPGARPLPASGAESRVYVDLNGDGQADGFVLMTHGPAGGPAPAPALAVVHEPAAPAFVAGASLTTHFDPT